MTSSLRGWGGGGWWGWRGYGKNEMLLDVGGAGLVSVLNV